MRPPLFALLFLSCFLFVSPEADAQEFVSVIGHSGMGRCHMDICTFFYISDSKPVGSTKEGTLFAIATQQWENEYKARGEGDDHEYDRAPVTMGKPTTVIAFVFCSKTRPVEFFYSEGKWSSNALRPGDESAVSGAAEYAYVFYWASCHNFITKDPVSASLAASLRYRFKVQPAKDDDRSGAETGLQPLDVLR
jgi:hypothetical protein